MAVPENTIRYVMFSALALAAIFAVLSTAGNYWMTLKVADLHSGLWSVCTRGKCFPSDGGDSLKATKALMVISCVCYVFAFAYCVLVYFMRNLSIKFLAAILFVTCILEVAALSVYTDHMKLGQYSWSYVLGWCSAILTPVAGVLCFFDSGYTQLE